MQANPLLNKVVSKQAMQGYRYSVITEGIKECACGAARAGACGIAAAVYQTKLLGLPGLLLTPKAVIILALYSGISR